MKLTKFTVVGLYADNNQVIVDWVEAAGPATAASKLRAKMRRVGGGAVLCVFKGHHIDRHGADELYEE